MDGAWIYGSRLAQIHQTLVEGRPNGMPAWGGEDPRSSSSGNSRPTCAPSRFPQTIAAETDDTPGQTAGRRAARRGRGPGLDTAGEHHQRLWDDHRRLRLRGRRVEQGPDVTPRGTARSGLLFASMLFAAFALADDRAVPLTVCADPNDLPFSNQAQQGFENKIAQLIAVDLASPAALSLVAATPGLRPQDPGRGAMRPLARCGARHGTCGQHESLLPLDLRLCHAGIRWAHGPHAG